jgi:predicted TIM-barrel fold metal-dependent hydrolase
VSRPKRPPPDGATDCHAHVFGPFDRFPLTRDRLYTPAELPGQRYLGMLDDLGFSRGVLVQPIAHGTDCAALLNALNLDPTRLRGVALIQPNVTDNELAIMHAHGVRGARFSRPPPGMMTGSIDFDALPQLAPRLARLGWHAQIWAPCAELVAALPELLELGVPLVIDHMGMFDTSRGVSDASFQSLLRLLGDGRIWLKLIAYRLSKDYSDYAELAPFHKALLKASPKRLLWGTDWPHVHVSAHTPDTGHLVDLFDEWTADAALRQRILVENPAALYGF